MRMQTGRTANTINAADVLLDSVGDERGGGGGGGGGYDHATHQQHRRSSSHYDHIEDAPTGHDSHEDSSPTRSSSFQSTASTHGYVSMSVLPSGLFVRVPPFKLFCVVISQISMYVCVFSIDQKLMKTNDVTSRHMDW